MAILFKQKNVFTYKIFKNIKIIDVKVSSTQHGNISYIKKIFFLQFNQIKFKNILYIITINNKVKCIDKKRKVKYIK